MTNAVGTPQHIEELKKQAEKLKQEIRVSTISLYLLNCIKPKCVTSL